MIRQQAISTKSKAQSSRRRVSLPETTTWKLTVELKRMTEKFKKLSARLKRLSENKRTSIELGAERGQEITAQSECEEIDGDCRRIFDRERDLRSRCGIRGHNSRAGIRIDD